MPYKVRAVVVHCVQPGGLTGTTVSVFSGFATSMRLSAVPLYVLPLPALRRKPCGHLCDEETFYTLDGFPISIFVPEAGCPVHDAED